LDADCPFSSRCFRFFRLADARSIRWELIQQWAGSVSVWVPASTDIPHVLLEYCYIVLTSLIRGSGLLSRRREFETFAILFLTGLSRRYHFCPEDIFFLLFKMLSDVAATQRALEKRMCG
jgi:hypothetical protein